ncbi:haloacid dehalogenase type II [Nocardioides deserti]|uniref:Haloacid dehalogenase type II n=1 Tax=Nocardioides deserti TaxID=1588644 RepID=A0ABR6U553_9ACTN|nr:haloacid dehalogenase type II [Nocardioides deserti]MBC2959566.1 haloacid dehalogenase type II [Nocardioides deserti]GGO73918.1 dehalogenase [Nocardioides deserti]
MRPRLLLLDVNETLSDTAAMAGAFARAGAAPELAGTWFASVLRDGFALAAAGAGAPFVDLARHHLGRLAGPERAEQLLEAFLALDVHPDVRTGLPRLAEAGVRVATLSNGSASVAEDLLERAGVREHVEACLSVEDAGVWKPHPRSYRWAVERLGVDAAEAALVAVHPWDTDGAARAGLGSVWVDRTGEPYPPYLRAPGRTVTSFDELAEALG